MPCCLLIINDEGPQHWHSLGTQVACRCLACFLKDDACSVLVVLGYFCLQNLPFEMGEPGHSTLKCFIHLVLDEGQPKQSVEFARIISGTKNDQWMNWFIEWQNKTDILSMRERVLVNSLFSIKLTYLLSAIGHQHHHHQHHLMVIIKPARWER